MNGAEHMIVDHNMVVTQVLKRRRRRSDWNERGPEVARCCSKLGRVHLSLDHKAEAEDCCKRSVAILERTGGDPLDLAIALEDYAAVQRRLADCVTRGAADSAVLDAAQRLEAFASQLEQPNPDAIDDGVDLTYAAEEAAEDVCGEPSATDRALLLIGRLHAARP